MHPAAKATDSSHFLVHFSSWNKKNMRKPEKMDRQGSTKFSENIFKKFTPSSKFAKKHDFWTLWIFLHICIFGGSKKSFFYREYHSSKVDEWQRFPYLYMKSIKSEIYMRIRLEKHVSVRTSSNYSSQLAFHQFWVNFFKSWWFHGSMNKFVFFL